MIRIAKVGRHFALFEDTDLLALVVYRKGAERLKTRLEDLLVAVAERDRYICGLQQEKLRPPGDRDPPREVNIQFRR